MVDTLITGFTPFDGRAVNASWIAARGTAEATGARALEVPVTWSSPLALLAPLCKENPPDVIISMGEGREGWFDIETVARNRRLERADNDGRMPNGEPVCADGPPQLKAGIDALRLRRLLAPTGIPVRVSRDAGAFLCEEMLYTLETLRRQPAGPTTVVFVHLPPWGTTFTRRRAQVTCNEETLLEFGRALFDAVMELHAA